MVAEWASERLAPQKTNEITSSFEEEVAAFERMQTSLLEKYAGKYVVIYQGKVIANGNVYLDGPNKLFEVSTTPIIKS